MLIKYDGVSDFVVDRKGGGSEHYIDILDKDMKRISSEKTYLNFPTNSSFTDEKNEKIYLFGYGFGIIDVKKKCFEDTKKYIKEYNILIDDVNVKDDVVYLSTNEGVKNVSKENWYKSRIISSDGKFNTDVHDLIGKIIFFKDKLYLEVLGFKHSKLLMFDEKNKEFFEVKNSRSTSGRCRYFTLNDKLFVIGLYNDNPFEICDFENFKRYKFYYEDGREFNDYYSGLIFTTYNNEVYFTIDREDKSDPENGIYKVVFENEAFYLKKIISISFTYHLTFYNNCLSIYTKKDGKRGVSLYALKTYELLKRMDGDNLIAIIKLKK